MTELETLIRAEIRAKGPMRFDRFMEMALYQPGLGYYAKDTGPVAIGRSGDFYTSVSVGPLFGRLLARQFWQMWKAMGKPDSFWIMEQGAHDGRLACDILEWCRKETPDFFAAAQYAIIEEAPGRSHAQRELLGPVDKRVLWFKNLQMLALAKPGGVFFCNELLDAFPVQRWAFRDGKWMERCVVVDAQDQLEWTDEPTEKNPTFAAYLSGIQPAGIEGYATETCPSARGWMRDVGLALQAGYVLVIDYGYPASIYYAPHRKDGTLTAYRDHRRSDNVLADPGRQDITAHVNFTWLSQVGKLLVGLETLGFLDQQHFMMGIAHDELAGVEGPKVGLAENLRAWNTLTHPEFLGIRFQNLLLAKDAPAELDGLRFARAGGLA